MDPATVPGTLFQPAVFTSLLIALDWDGFPPIHRDLAKVGGCTRTHLTTCVCASGVVKPLRLQDGLECRQVFSAEDGYLGGSLPHMLDTGFRSPAPVQVEIRRHQDVRSGVTQRQGWMAHTNVGTRMDPYEVPTR